MARAGQIVATTILRLAFTQRWRGGAHGRALSGKALDLVATAARANGCARHLTTRIALDTRSGGRAACRVSERAGIRIAAWHPGTDTADAIAGCTVIGRAVAAIRRSGIHAATALRVALNPAAIAVMVRSW